MAGSSDSSNLDSPGDSPDDDPNRTRNLHGAPESVPSGSSKQRKKFHPFRAVRNIFRRAKRQGSEDDPQLHSSSSKKSRSTSELNSTSGLASSPASEQHHGYGSSSGLLLHPNSVVSPGGNGGLHAGLSVSHDSIFASEPAMGGPAALHQAGGGQGQPGSALSVPHVAGLKSFKDELRARFRGRRDSDEEDDDPGLPHSPCTSPTTADVLAQGLKDMSGIFSSGHSSRRSTDFEGDPDVSQPVPLNHNAALHKMAVRPKRTHGLPKHRRMQQMALAGVGQSLPATPEVMEDISLALLATPQLEVTTHEESTVSGDLVELAEELVGTSIYCTSPSETLDTNDVEAITETTVIEPLLEIVTDSSPESPKPLEESEPVAGPSAADGEAQELMDTELPPVKPPKSKAKSARLKFEHEVKQFSKRQQEKLKDPTSEVNELLDVNQNFECEAIETSEFKAQVQETDEIEISVNHLEQNENIKVDMTLTSKDDLTVKVEPVSNKHNKPAEETDVEKPTVFMVESVSESLMNVFFGNDATTNLSSQEPMHISEINLKEPDQHVARPGQSMVLDEIPKINVDSLESIEVEESVVLRHPERASLTDSSEAIRIFEAESTKSSELESPLKSTEVAFSSGDFAGIMKKRRSMTDSSVPTDVKNIGSRRPISEDVRKVSNPSKRLSVEIISFDERSKEPTTIKPEDPRKEDGLLPELSKNSESAVDKTLQLVDSTAPCPPVTIRIRRGKSLSERSSDVPSEVLRPEVKAIEKPLVRPRSQILNQEESQGKVPEFMKIQLRSSREELDSCKSEPKSESVVAAQPPHWEVKIQPQKSQRKLSAGPTSLPYNLGKPSSPEVANDVEIKSTPQKDKPEVSSPKQFETRTKLPLQKLDAKPDSSADLEQRPKPIVSKTEVRTETQLSRDAEQRTKQLDERQSLRLDDSSKSRRNSSSENKENVALSNVQNDLIERRISVDESRQELAIEKPSGTDNRRRSYVLPKEVEDHEPELFRVFARRSIKQKNPEKSKKDEPSKDEATPKSETTATSKPDIPVSKPEVAQTPIKPRVETKLVSEEKTPPKRIEPLPNKPLLREHPKPLDKFVTPSKVAQTAESPSPASKSPSLSPKIQSPEILPLKPERRESLSFRNKIQESQETQLDKQTGHITKNRANTDPIKPMTPISKPSDIPICKIERRESASFKVKPSDNISNNFTQKDRSKTESESPKPLLAVKRAEFVKTASLDSPGPKDCNKDAPTWLQLAQQRREKREQKERMLYGQNSNSFVLEGSNKPSRNSKVLDLVNNFQKRQTT